MVDRTSEVKLALFGCVSYFDTQTLPKHHPQHQRLIRGRIYCAKRLFAIHCMDKTMVKIPYVKQCTSWKTIYRFLDCYDILQTFIKLNLSLPYEHEIPPLPELRGDVKVPERGPDGKFLPKARVPEIGIEGGDLPENTTTSVEAVEGD